AQSACGRSPAPPARDAHPWRLAGGCAIHARSPPAVPRQAALGPPRQLGERSGRQYDAEKGGQAILRREKGGGGVLELCSTCPRCSVPKRYYPGSSYWIFSFPGFQSLNLKFGAMAI